MMVMLGWREGWSKYDIRGIHNNISDERSDYKKKESTSANEKNIIMKKCANEKNIIMKKQKNLGEIRSMLLSPLAI